MTIYAVFDRDATGAPAVVPDRFSWLAALLPPLFALLHGLWLELVVYVIAVVLLGAAAPTFGGTAIFWIYVAFALWIGFEAPAMRRSALRRRGWRFRSDIVAASSDMAELEGFRSRRP
jgi:hypothetical protein